MYNWKKVSVEQDYGILVVMVNEVVEDIANGAVGPGFDSRIATAATSLRSCVV